MKITVITELDVTPGTDHTIEEIAADAVQAIQGTALQLGFGYGAEPYKVNSATTTASQPIAS